MVDKKTIARRVVAMAGVLTTAFVVAKSGMFDNMDKKVASFEKEARRNIVHMMSEGRGTSRR